MAEYSRLASGQVTSNGGNTLVINPFTPTRIEIFNQTRAAAQNGNTTTTFCISKAGWYQDMGVGAAWVTQTTTTGDYTGFIAPSGGTSSSIPTLVSGTGFSTFQGGLSQQYGPTVFLGASGGITKASPAVVTTTAAHGLVSGNVVIFQNLAQTSTTGMQQIAGIPLVVTVTGTTTFTIPWNTNQSNYTAISTGGLNTLASFKQVLYPSLYVPGTAYISSLTLGSSTVVNTTAPHNFVVGQEIAFRIPLAWGTIQLNSLPNVVIPGSPIYGFVTAVSSSTSFTVNINSSSYTAFNSNQIYINYPGQQFPQVVAVGDNNSGSNQFGYNSPTVYNGSSTTAVSTINGPAIAGAYINATSQGFIIGSGVSGTAADVIDWVAYLDDYAV